MELQWCLDLFAGDAATCTMPSRGQVERCDAVPPQALSNSDKMAMLLSDTRASDHFRNLFETPVLFYGLVACAVATVHVPSWLVAGAWVYRVLRAAQSLVHCTYNRATHRFVLFVSGFLALVLLWTGFVVGHVIQTGA